MRVQCQYLALTPLLAPDEPLTVAMCVSNPDRSPLRIHRCNPPQTPTRFLEITGNYFPVLHAGCVLRPSQVPPMLIRRLRMWCKARSRVDN
jgi:hypothetical protein